MTATRTEPPVHPEFDDPPADATALLRSWFEQAKDAGVREPGALALATTDEHGHTTSRIVMTLKISDDGLLFTSHAGSHKGRDLDHEPWASGVLYWRETRQQVTLAGPVHRLSDVDSDALWASRPPSTYPMSVASRQSAELLDEEELRSAAQDLEGKDLARPAQWSGYVLVPERLEFWLESPDRLHRRLLCELDGDRWHATRLQP